MDKETYEALKNIMTKAYLLMDYKYGKRKRFNQDEVWEKATFLRDFRQMEIWIDEVAKEYEED